MDVMWNGGMVFISPCITNGANAIYAKRNVITKMKFPVSVLPATVVGKELFNHFCLMAILVVFLLTQGSCLHFIGLNLFIIFLQQFV